MSNLSIRDSGIEVVPSSNNLGWTQAQVDLLKTQIAPDCSNDELKLFVQICERTGLDPFAKQIYALQRRSKDSNGNWISKMSIQTSIDGYRLIADRTGKYAGSETFWCGNDGQWFDVWLSNEPPAAAKVLVWKTGSDKPFVGIAKYKSYVQTTSKGDPTSMWAKMPDLMIGKCAEALALRKAFPAELSGLYTREEMAQADNDVIDAQVVNPQPIASPLQERIKKMMRLTKFNKSDVRSVCNKDGLPTESAQFISNELVDQLRDAMFIEWGVRQGFSDENLYMSISETFDSDEQIFEAWQSEIANAVIKTVPVEVA